MTGVFEERRAGVGRRILAELEAEHEAVANVRR
jgi:hypothetical protein